MESTEPSLEKMISAHALSITKNAWRLAQVGEWPDGWNLDDLLNRLPSNGGRAEGFSPIIACALGLVPVLKWRLTARLHNDWDAEAVQQLRHETAVLHPDSETTWWLAAYSFEQHLPVDAEQFLADVRMFSEQVERPSSRIDRARRGLVTLRGLSSEEVYGHPFGVTRGAIEGAYLRGHRYGTMFDSQRNIITIQTYLSTLGLEDFKWSYGAGPIMGSPRRVRCSSFEEMREAVKVVRKYHGV